MILGLAVAATAFCAAPSFAEEQTSQPTTNNRDVIVCKRVPSATGTRLGSTKECHTQGEWDDRQRQDREMTEGAQKSDMRGSPGG
jgi:hypothetical protein